MDRPDGALQTASRQAWGDLEVLHVVGYFAPVVTQEYVDLGLDARLAYFPARAAAFGEAGPGLVTATFYVFAPTLVHAALPASWEGVTADAMVRARRRGMGVALHDLLGEPDVGEALEIARAVCAGLTPQGRALYAAHADLDWPDEPLLALWHAATLIREHRGDGHVAVLQSTALDPVEATVLGGLYSSSTTFLRRTRGWSREDYAAAEQRLQVRGWLGEDADLSELGRTERQRVEDDTDRLATAAWAAVGLEATRRLHELVRPLRQQVLAADLLPRSLRA